MKRLVVAALVSLALVAVAYETSGQGQVSGRLVTPGGEGVQGCLVQRDMRLGFWFGGGFDDLAYMTAADGRFRLPVARGFNRLSFNCDSRGAAQGRAVVWRHLEPDVKVVLPDS